MMTRKEYMSADRKDGKAHRAYYAQFVTPGTKARVLAVIGRAGLLASKDASFNDIPLPRWYWVCPRLIPVELNKAMRAAGDYPTPAGLVCIAKEAAQQIVEETRLGKS